MATVDKTEYYQFIKELDTLRSAIQTKFENMTVSELDNLVDNIDSTLSQWDYLNSDILSMIDIIENIEE